MPKQQIPDREPIGDAVHGIISQVSNRYILSSHPIASATQIADGEFMIRYGITYLGKPYLSIVPDLVVLDYGEMLVGEDAWEFLTTQSNLYPRADVLGYRNEGQDEMLVVKQLDLAIPFDVLAYGNETDRTPLTKLSALISSECNSYPDRLLNYLQCYDTVTEWQANNE